MVYNAHALNSEAEHFQACLFTAVQLRVPTSTGFHGEQ